MEQEIVADLNQSAPSVTETEKLVPQSKVNEIIHAKTAAAYEKGRREAQAQPQSNMGGMPQMTPEHIQKMIAEEAQRQMHELAGAHERQAQEQEAHRIASEFHGKISAGKSRYEDFDNVMQDVDLATMPHIVQLAHATDNTADVMYELAKNPGKIATLTTLAYTNPALARREMNRLSESIKNNQAAAQQKLANEPLNQISPSTVGTDSGSLTLKDLKNASWLRG